MSEPIIIYENFAAASTASIACAQADADFPASWLNDWDAARQMRLTAGTWDFTVTMTDTPDADFFGLLGCSNLAGQTITVEGKASAPASFSTLGTIVMGTGRNGNLLLSGLETLYQVKFSASGGGSPYGRIGQVYVGESVTLEKTYFPGYLDNLSFPVLETGTEGGDRFVYQLGEERRVLTLAWDAMTATLRAQLEALFRGVKGSVYPFCHIDHLGALNFMRGPAAREWEHVFSTLGSSGLVLTEEPMPFDPAA